MCAKPQNDTFQHQDYAFARQEMERVQKEKMDEELKLVWPYG
jgi:hypothetical protein